VALDAIFFLVYTGIFIAWFVIRLVNIHKKSPLKWYFYGLALLALILYAQPCSR
jgi:hypothetical protein